MAAMEPDTTVSHSDSRRVVILGAGPNVKGDLPPAMVAIDQGLRVLDWLLASFAVLPSPEVFFVGGYKAQVVEGQYPDIRFFFNPDWRETGPAGSLAVVPLTSASATYVCYSDVVFRPDSVKRMDAVEADLVLAVDSKWRVRYDARGRSDLDSAEKVRCESERVIHVGRQVPTADATAEFAGLLKLSPKTAARLQAIVRSGEVGLRAGLPAIITQLLAEGATAAFVDVQGDWAELNAPQDLARFVLGTKAESLERLKPLIQRGSIGEIVSFTHRQWLQSPTDMIAHIKQVFGDSDTIVRSSALSEDTWHASSAGAYTSLLDVPTADTERLTAAIDEVFQSYGDKLGDNQVLVQEMLRDVVMSGVIMTRTPALGAPYYVANFDDTTSRTDTVTSGAGSTLRTVFLHRSASLRPEFPKHLHDLIDIVAELEEFVGHDSLDIEFAFTRDGTGHVLQVRPIAVAHRDQPMDDRRILKSIDDARRYFAELAAPRPFLLGKSTQFSVMADWNPAEMIGTKPGRLAFSLYRHLITDEAWARQRAEYGYRDVRPGNLIVDLLGHPFIDVRVDFNSFIPASLSDDLAARLADHYLDRLTKHPELHDKVEFDILFTCLTFDFDEQAKRLTCSGFSQHDIEQLRDALRDVTVNGIARCADDVDDLVDLRQRFEHIMTTGGPPLERAHVLFDDVRRIGAPLFSHLARHAFVAVSLLKSMVAAGHITEQQSESFLASIRTVPSAMQKDARRVSSGDMSWEDFINEYGHLRPGSYDITSPAYASAPKEYLRPMIQGAEFAESTPDSASDPWDAGARERVERAMQELGFDIGFDALITFMRQSIEGREFGKFTFMRNVNAALEAIADFGAAHGVSREQLSHIRIHELLALRAANTEEVPDILSRLVHDGREASFITQAVCLPGQLFSDADLLCFERVKAEPNFVTRKNIRADIAALSGHIDPEIDLTGKIVLLPNADPGFDWLFSRDIAGLITMYGGVNSHMAIRAAEFQLPAAIGIGEVLYEELSQAQLLELDCGSRRIKVVH